MVGDFLWNNKVRKKRTFSKNKTIGVSLSVHITAIVQIKSQIVLKKPNLQLLPKKSNSSFYWHALCPSSSVKTYRVMLIGAPEH